MDRKKSVRRLTSKRTMFWPARRWPRAVAIATAGTIGAAGAVRGLLAILPDRTPGQRPCGSSDYACRLNVNQGTFTVMALVVAGVTGLAAYADYASGRRDRRLEQERTLARFSSTYFDALYEAVHNLHHLARAFEAGKIRAHRVERWPEYDLRHASQLLTPPNLDYLDPSVRQFVDHMLRNDLYLHRFPNTPAGRKKILASTSYLAEHVMRFLLEAWCREEPEANALFEQLRAEGKLRSLTDRKHEIKRSGFRVRLDKHEAEQEPGKAGSVLLWWFDDQHGIRSVLRGLRGAGMATSPLFDDLWELDDPPPLAPRPPVPARSPHVHAGSAGHVQ